MGKIGFKWDRYTAGNLERGRRQSVTVEELLGLAYVLDVAPVHLVAPLASDELMRFLPEQVATSAVVREWLRGRIWMPHPGGNEKTYFTEVPDEEWTPPPQLTEAELERQRAARLAQLDELAQAGVMERRAEPGGAVSYSPRPPDKEGER